MVRDALGADDVLYLHGHAGKGRGVGGRQAVIGSPGLLQGLLPGYADKRLEPLLHRSYTLKAGLGQLSGAYPPFRQQVVGLMNSQVVEVSHVTLMLLVVIKVGAMYVLPLFL